MNASTSTSQARTTGSWADVLWACALKIAGLLERLSRLLDDPPGEKKPPRELPLPSSPNGPAAVLVIDASPSMEDTDWPPSRLRAAQDAAKAYVRRLKDNVVGARVAVVAYGDSAHTVCRLTPVNNSGSLEKKIDRITTGSATNITAGLKRAHSLLKGATGTSQVVLLTDGAHNTGPEPHGIAAKLRAIAELETVGIGGTPEDVDEDLLRAIASAFPYGRKRYRWIGDKEQLVGHFETLARRLARS